MNIFLFTYILIYILSINVNQFIFTLFADKCYLLFSIKAPRTSILVFCTVYSIVSILVFRTVSLSFTYVVDRKIRNFLFFHVFFHCEKNGCRNTLAVPFPPPCSSPMQTDPFNQGL